MCVELFSPQKQTNVWDVQTTIRQIDMALGGSTKKWGDQGFVYSTLAGCCSLLDANISEFSLPIQTFVEKVKETVAICFKEIEKANFELSSRGLLSALKTNLENVQYYPQKNVFEVIPNQNTPAEHLQALQDLMSQIQNVITVGTLVLYKLKPNDPQYYAARVDLPNEAFEQAVKIATAYGFRAPNDDVGSSFDKQGHVTTIEPKELSQKYDAIKSAHEKGLETIPLRPIGIKIGSPQAGKLARMVGIVLDDKEINEYRNRFGFGKMMFAPHVTVFSQEIKPLAGLKDVSVENFTDQKDHPYLTKLHQYLLGSK